jgi:hypothetical protein
MDWAENRENRGFDNGQAPADDEIEAATERMRASARRWHTATNGGERSAISRRAGTMTSLAFAMNLRAKTMKPRVSTMDFPPFANGFFGVTNEFSASAMGFRPSANGFWRSTMNRRRWTKGRRAGSSPGADQSFSLPTNFKKPAA